uniref:PRP1 splicing factor N-terminal domain-containing protein n=1 Tax=Guillardia theta (strain CCMP2712) TaxID=905079 RepID=A0A0C3UDZ0_GUITC
MDVCAGLGRGATGFTTRSDIGFGGKDDVAGEKEEDLGDSNYNEFYGYGGALFSDTPYEQDDQEADAVWDAVDQRMDGRRKERREAREKEELRKYRAKLPTLHSQFADIKRDLQSLSREDWVSIPDANDISHKKRRVDTMKDRFMPAPDSLLAQAQAEQAGSHNELDTRQQVLGGITTVSGDADSSPFYFIGSSTQSQFTDLNKVGEGRNTYLQLKLDRVSDSVSGQTVVDPKGYLTDLNSQIRNQAADVADIKQARLLLKSAITSNPKHAPAWIAASRLEVIAGKVSQARNLIMQGCEAVPLNEDIWLEAASIHPPEQAKKIIAQAVHHLPTKVSRSTNLLTLIAYSSGLIRRVLRRALELIPDSERLWKAAVELEDKETRVLLTRAVEDGCCPLSVDLWLALARLEEYQEARKVLNNARKKVPSEPQIWFTAAKLEEANGNGQNVPKILERAMRQFADMKLKVSDDRDFWQQEAEKAEKGGYPVVAEGLIKVSADVNVLPHERRRVWEAEAEALLERGAVHCARTLYSSLLQYFNTKKKIWMAAANLEKKHGTPEALDQLLKKALPATTFCPKAWPLWLMGAKEKWSLMALPGLTGCAGARVILGEAFKINPDNEEIWLAAVKLENDNNEIQRARTLLEKARMQAGTERVWMKSVMLERDQGNMEAACELLTQALEKYPTFAKLWMILIQIKQSMGLPDEARDAYLQGTSKCPSSVALWIVAVHFERDSNQLTKARSLLEKARLKNPKHLWLETIRMEAALPDNRKLAATRLAQALQECPNSGILWSEAILMEPRQQRKAKSVDAIKHCENDTFVICTIARLFHADRKLEKARTWFNRACTLNPDFGDAWAHWFRLEQQHGTDETRAEVIRRCKDANPRHGEVWQRVSKAAGKNFADVGEKLMAVVQSITEKASLTN